MIRARFIPDTVSPVGELLHAARQLLSRSALQAEELIRGTRAKLAVDGWTLRQRLHRRGVRILSRERARLQAASNLEAERQLQRAIANAHRDCLEVALTVAKEVVGELLATDAERIAARVKRGLERLSQGRVLSIEVLSGGESALQAALENMGAPIPVHPTTDLAPGVVRLRTVHGPVEMPWEEEFAEMANRLRSVLEARIAAVALQEAA